MLWTWDGYDAMTQDRKRVIATIYAAPAHSPPWLEFLQQSIGLQEIKHTGVGTSSPWLMGHRPSLAGVAVAPLGWTALGLSGDAAVGSAARSSLVSKARHIEREGQRTVRTWTG